MLGAALVFVTTEVNIGWKNWIYGLEFLQDLVFLDELLENAVPPEDVVPLVEDVLIVSEKLGLVLVTLQTESPFVFII